MHALRRIAVKVVALAVASASVAQDSARKNRIESFRAAAATGETLTTERIQSFVADLGDTQELEGSTLAALQQDFGLARRLLAAGPDANTEFAAYVDWLEGIVLRDLGQHDASRAAFRRSHVRWLETELNYGGLIAIELANAERFAGDYGRALELLREFDTSERATDVWSRLEAWDVQGRIYMNLGLPDVAATVFERERRLVDSFELQPDDPDRRRKAFAWWSSILHRTSLALVREDVDEVSATIGEARAHSLFPSVPPKHRAELDLHLGIAKAMRAVDGKFTGDDGLGELTACREAPAVGDAALTKAELWTARLLLDRGDREGAAPLVLAAAARLASSNGFTRNHVLLASLEARIARTATDAARADITPHLAHLDAMLDSWKTVAPRAGGLGLQLYDDAASFLSELVLLQLAVHGEEVGAARALDVMMRVQALGSLTRHLVSSEYSLTDLRRLLCRDGAGVLVYQFGRRRSHVFAIDASDLRHFEIGPSRTLAASVAALQSRLREELRRSDGAGFDGAVGATAKRLAKGLLPSKVQAKLAGWSAVRVVGLDSLGAVPFECLPLESGSRVGAEFAVSHLPSLPLGCRLDELSATNDADPGSVVLVGAPPPATTADALGADMPPLPLTRDEAERLFAAYSPGRRTIRIAERATTAALADLTGAEMLQLLTHTVQDAARPERSRGLLLAEPGGDGAMWADEIDTITAPPLVVLGACSAGVGPVRRGDDGPAHLGSAFLRAGAATVVLPRSDIEFHDTVRVLTRVHDYLAAGVRVDEALRSVRSEAAGSPSAIAPFLLQVVGSGDLRLRADKNSYRSRSEWQIPWIWIIGAGALLLIGYVGSALLRGRRL